MADAPPKLNQVNTPPSLQEIAFKAIKRAIIARDLAPDINYSETALAKQMGISKTPVHQALLELETRGFVTLMARKGFQVKRLTPKNISDMFELRRALERAVILKITPRLTSQALDDLAQILGRIGKTRDPLEFQEHDRAYHRYLAWLSGNQYFIESLNNVWDLSDWVGACALNSMGDFKRSLNEHAAIHDFLVRGDAEKAAAAMDRHLNSAERMFLDGMKKE
jgi:DNA-binding GntR family transcriptional regulator